MKEEGEEESSHQISHIISIYILCSHTPSHSFLCSTRWAFRGCISQHPLTLHITPLSPPFLMDNYTLLPLQHPVGLPRMHLPLPLSLLAPLSPPFSIDTLALLPLQHPMGLPRMHLRTTSAGLADNRVQRVWIPVDWARSV